MVQWMQILYQSNSNSWNWIYLNPKTPNSVPDSIILEIAQIFIHSDFHFRINKKYFWFI